MTLVWALPLRDSEKIVLLALADCANDEGICWPGMKSLVAKCSKSERTIQGCIHALEVAGHLTRNEEKGKGCSYLIHPRSDCAPATAAATPATAAGDPRNGCGVTIKNHKKPSPKKRAIPENWCPEPFPEGSESRKVIDSWPPGELAAQLEQFKAHHASKNNTFSDPQKAWSTWALNTRKWGVGKKENLAPKWVSATGHQYRGDDEAVMREAEKRSDWDTYWKVKATARQMRAA